VLYDSRDLVTHALCVGMTGSGKTGLAVGLIEEAALDGVPVIAIDPKGDIGNLLLTFPGLSAGEFEPWVNAEDAARAGQSVAVFAASEAEKWKTGLAKSGQDGARIQRLRDSAEFTVYTPGSTAGVPVSVLGNFAAPPGMDAELLAEQAQAKVSGLLALAGVDGDSLTSPAHILLANIMINVWQSGASLDLPALIGHVQSPPMQTIGVLAVDDFMPSKERFALAMALNALLAAPGFAVWTQGDALDPAAFLRTAEGKPRVSIFSIAHLDDKQRMFFVTQLLSAVVGWMRGQTGTSSLRAIVYMDEIFGYFPPVANPPSKQPLLTLLKQSRAFGLGIVLATQNPVDLDYRALGNIGTWWLGRLQTERDKQRLLDGLEGVSGGSLDRTEVDRLISVLPGRTFVMRNVHDDALTLMQTRWAMSYLRGPLSREDIRRLTPQSDAAATDTVPTQPAGITKVDNAASATTTNTRPLLPADVPQFFAPAPEGSALQPVLYAAVDVRFSNARLKIDATRQVLLELAVTDAAIAVDWTQARRTALIPDQLIADPPDTAQYSALPKAATKASNYSKWSRQLKSWIIANELIELHRSATGASSLPGESLREFQARLAQLSREGRDESLTRLRDKYSAKRATLSSKVDRARLAVERESQEAATSRLDTALSIGATVAGAILGGRSRRRATTAVRSAGRARKQGQDVAHAREALRMAQTTLEEFDARVESEVFKLQSGGSAAQIETIAVKPRRDSVEVRLLALVWKAADG
nr:DUF87 domain-containing protein [bacterium]